MDYNTNREKLIMPEYGRHIQKMIEHVKQIPDRDKRNEQIRAVVSVMAILNPQLSEQPDYMHKLWDHVQIIAGFDIDVDAPYPVPAREAFTAPPDVVPMPKEPLAAAHYGRNIQNMVKVIAKSRRNIFPVTDEEGKLLGIVLLDDIRSDEHIA